MKIINIDLYKWNNAFSSHLHLTYVFYFLFNFFELRLGNALLLLGVDSYRRSHFPFNAGKIIDICSLPLSWFGESKQFFESLESIKILREDQAEKWNSRSK